MSALIAHPSTGELLVDATPTGGKATVGLSEGQLELLVSALRVYDSEARDAAAHWRRHANDPGSRGDALEHAEHCERLGQQALTLRQELKDVLAGLRR